MKIEFIIPTYDRDYPLTCMLSSLLSQTTPDWCAHIIIDDEYSERFTHLGSYNYDDERIRYTFLGKRYNDWGHTPREMGKQLSEADYILMTNDDNYYTPNFVEEFVKASETAPGIVYWDMIHSHYNYSYFKCVPAYNQIDMGAFAVRRDIAQSIKMNTTYAADGEYIEDIKKKYPNERMIKIDKVLFVHN